MLRKYRQIGQGGKVGWTKVVYFFLAWNVLGMVAYSWYKKRSETLDPAFNKMTGTQKYLYFMSSPQDKVTVLNIKGLKPMPTEETTAEDYTYRDMKKE